MSRIYVNSQCFVCGESLDEGEDGFLVQEVRFTRKDLKTFNKRKLRAKEVRIIQVPGTRVPVHRTCMNQMNYPK